MINSAGFDFVADISMLWYALKTRITSGCCKSLSAITLLSADPFACGKCGLTVVCVNLYLDAKLLKLLLVNCPPVSPTTSSVTPPSSKDMFQHANSVGTA